jgi:hypothetical protein
MSFCACRVDYRRALLKIQISHSFFNGAKTETAGIAPGCLW